MNNLIDRLERLIDRASRQLGWLAPTLARVALGTVFVQTGWGKLHSLADVEQFFRQLGIPAPGAQAVFVSGVEFVGGLLLIAGLLTRFAAVPLMGTMVVAILTAQRAQIHGLGDLFGLIEFAYLSLFLWIALAGAGPVSLDHLLARARRRRSPAPSLPASQRAAA